MNIRYFTIFCLSFVILSLQIILCLFLDVIAYLPFFAISFAFLGLTLEGIFIYIRQGDARFDEKYGMTTWARQLMIGGMHIIISMVILLCYNRFALAVISQASLLQNQIFSAYFKLHIFSCSILAGCLFSISFFQFGLIMCALYREHPEQSPRLYLFDLCGAACGCIFAVIVLSVLQVGSVLIVLSLAAFVLAWFLNRRLSGGAHVIRALTPVLLAVAAAVLLFMNIKFGIFEIKLPSDIRGGGRSIVRNFGPDGISIHGRH